jgi:glutamyl-tRNA reductase
MTGPEADPSGLSAGILVVGANHRSSPLALRDRLFVEDAAVPGFLARLQEAGLRQALALSTCDRVEVQAVAAGDDAADTITRVFAAQGRMEPVALGGQLYTLHGMAAVRHIFAVAASLDSLIVGEPQVLGQVKASHRLARSAGMVGPELDSVLQAAYAAAKRVRTETAVGEGPVSIAAAAVQLARNVHGDLARCSGLLVGLGEMGELMSEQLRAAGLGRLTVTAPSPSRCEALARHLTCHRAPFEALASSLVDADIVIAALGNGVRTVGVEMMREALRRRRHRPVFLIDAAIPGDLEPAVNELDDAFLYDLDDLERVALQGRVSREAAAAAAWSIVDEELVAWRRGLAERDAVPAVVALRRHFEATRSGVLANGSQDAAAATRLLVGRLLHAPSEVLREIASAEGSDQAAAAARLLRRLFRLDGEAATERTEETDE